MKVIRPVFRSLRAAALGLAALALLPAAPAYPQIDPAELGKVDEQIAVLEATLAQLQPDLAALDRAVADSATQVWPTDAGWDAASTEELENKVAFLQMAATRPESKDLARRIAGLELPAALDEAARQQTDRPARRLVREWVDGEGAANRKEVAVYQRHLKRTVKMTESWLDEQRAVKEAALRPNRVSASYPQGACYVPPGEWAIGSTKEVLEVVYSGYFSIATKTRGNRIVPAGKTNFYVNAQTCNAGLQTADEGFVDPYWVRARIQVNWLEPGKQFSIDWPEREPIVYTRVN